LTRLNMTGVSGLCLFWLNIHFLFYNDDMLKWRRGFSGSPETIEEMEAPDACAKENACIVKLSYDSFLEPEGRPHNVSMYGW